MSVLEIQDSNNFCSSKCRLSLPIPTDMFILDQAFHLKIPYYSKTHLIFLQTAKAWQASRSQWEEKLSELLVTSMIEVLSRRPLLGVREITVSYYQSHKIVKAAEKSKCRIKKFTVSQNPCDHDPRKKRSLKMEFNNLSCFSLSCLLIDWCGKKWEAEAQGSQVLLWRAGVRIQAQMKRTQFRIQHNQSPCQQGWHILGKMKDHTIGGEWKCKRKCSCKAKACCDCWCQLSTWQSLDLPSGWASVHASVGLSCLG